MAQTAARGVSPRESAERNAPFHSLFFLKKDEKCKKRTCKIKQSVIYCIYNQILSRAAEGLAL